MRKFRLGGLLVLAAAVAVAVVAGGAAANAGRPSSGVVGQIYINDNTAPVEHRRRL